MGQRPAGTNSGHGHAEGRPTWVRRAGTAAAVALGLGLGPAAAGAAPLPAPVAQATSLPTEVVVGRGERLVFERDVRRVFVADPEVLRSEVLDSREVLISAVRPGVTTLITWFESGEPLQQVVSVRRDVALLEGVLQGIDPGIQVDFAPDRDLIVLRGVVATEALADAAVAAAEAYLGAGTEVPLLTEDEDGKVDAPATGEDAAPPRRRGGVVDLLRVRTLPATMEQRIAAAIAPIAGDAVTVRRIQVDTRPDDGTDVFLLEGSVDDQVTLTRSLFIASRALLGAGAGGASEVRALADEAGALTQARNIFGAAAGGAGGGGNQQQGLQAGNNSALGGGGQQGQQLANRIGAQVGRAKVVEAAGGRILSTIQVEHLPLVRVDVRLYEVNRTRLRTWRNQLRVAGADFDQPALVPSPESTALQGANAPAVGDGDLQGLLGFLNGTLSGRGQAVTGGFAVDNLFQLLVEEELARSLSNPSLAVLSGELAQFQVGGQVPVPLAVTVGGGTDQVLNSVQFRDFGIDLTVRPLVEERSSSRITLDVVPRISLPDLALTAAIGSATGQATAATAFESRATRTSARVFDGEALVIGGLTTERSQEAQGRTPIVGSLPVLGWLFRNEANDREETELVIVVTPRIVREPRPEADLWAFPTAAEVHRRCLDRVAPARAPDAPEEGDTDGDA